MNKTQLKEFFSTKYYEAEEKVNALSLRERGMILGVSLFLIFMIWDTFIMENLSSSRKKYQTKTATINNQITSLKKEMKKVQNRIESDPAKRIEDLEKNNKILELKINSLANQLVPPKEMTKLLKNILNKKTKMKIIKLENLPEEKLLKQEKPPQGEEKKATPIDENQLEIYKHSMQFEVKGTFIDTLNFLTDIEKLKWKLIWENMEYEVEEYPYAIIKITVSTLSFNKEWIGV